MELPLYKQMNAGVFLNWRKRHKAFQLAKKPQPLFLAVIVTTWIPGIQILPRDALRFAKKFGEAFIQRTDCLTREVLQ